MQIQPWLEWKRESPREGSPPSVLLSHFPHSLPVSLSLCLFLVRPFNTLTRRVLFLCSPQQFAGLLLPSQAFLFSLFSVSFSFFAWLEENPDHPLWLTRLSNCSPWISKASESEGRRTLLLRLSSFLWHCDRDKKKVMTTESKKTEEEDVTFYCAN